MGEATLSLSAEKRAQEIQMSLDPAIPSLVRVMLPSHVGGGYWMGIPSKFCKSFMSKNDILMTLVDEDGLEFHEISYLPRNCGLSGGWQGFAKAHHLKEGDAVVFELVEVNKFKIHIVREEGGADAALDLLTLNKSQGNAVKNLKPGIKPTSKRQRCLQSAITEGKPTENLAKKRQRCFASAVVQDCDEHGNPPLPLSEQPDNNNEVVASAVEFEGINFESFTTVVNDLVRGRKMPEHVTAKYYKLCRSQNSFLHANLLPGLNFTLVTGIISETVSIADAIRSCELSHTCKGELTMWRNSLDAFEKLGMKVSFMISRIDELVKVSEIAVHSMRHGEFKAVANAPW
ncbi:hypothetical protein MKW92_015665 [Papaver armeniacum]|nr:hypothetical protein MKW92_015665 [Papaver armeniacum]